MSWSQMRQQDVYLYNLSSFELKTDFLSPILLCELQYFMYSCAIALLIQPSHSALSNGM